MDKVKLACVDRLCHSNEKETAIYENQNYEIQVLLSPAEFTSKLRAV